jgi:hypothetical protein
VLQQQKKDELEKKKYQILMDLNRKAEKEEKKK